MQSINDRVNNGIDFHVFLETFTRLVSHRYPTLTNVSREDLRSLADECIQITDVALDTWTNYSTDQRRSVQRQRSA